MGLWLSKKDSMSNQLIFINSDLKTPVSLSVFDSDYWGNLVVMEQVVGTLIKYGGVGRYEPFLAKKWSVSEDRKKWKFEFFPNLKTEDGIPINAENYSKCLKKLLRIYSKQYSPPTFNRLVGWDQFVQGHEDKIGIEVEGNELIFSFRVVPSGLLEFLSMPYFGFYSPNDFNGDNWKDSRSIKSSSIFRVKSFSESEILLEPRADWPGMDADIPSVAIRKLNVRDALTQNGPLIVSLRNSDITEQSGFVAYKSTPTIMTGVVLSPSVAPFTSLDVRKAFRTVLRHKLDQLHLESPGANKSKYFYQSFSRYMINGEAYDQAITLLKNLKLKSVSCFRQNLTHEKDAEFISKALQSIKSELGWEMKVDSPETLGREWMKKALSNQDYAVRIARVDIGGSPENWVIDMMFCSSLGVSFPDPNNRICEAVKYFEQGKYANTEAYWQAIHNAIETEAAVIPLFHTGFSWLISDSIDTRHISPSMNIPRFDQMRIQK